LAAPKERFNRARTIDSLLVDPLKELPKGSFGGFDGPIREALQMNLAFRNLIRGWMVALPSGQQMARFLEVEPLKAPQLLDGNGGAQPRRGDAQLAESELKELAENTPLWFCVLREAETVGQGRLGPVGSRIVAETFHRAMETSHDSIIRQPTWTPALGAKPGMFTMVDLLTFAFEGKRELLAPLG
jgi:hypothetical protein